MALRLASRLPSIYDGYTLESIREELFKRSRVHASRISKENQESYISTGHKPDGDWFRDED